MAGLSTYLSYDYVQRALIVGFLVALCAALLGVTLVLKRLSMIGDGLSHVGFGALAMAMALNWAPLTVAMPVVMAAAFFLLRLSEDSAIKGDTAIALISSSSLAIGLMLASRFNNMKINSYLFGSILAISPTDAVLSVILTLAVLGAYIFFYHPIFAVTFDEDFVKASGMPAGLYKMMIGLMTAIVIVVGMKLMGALLISSLIIFPGVTAMRLFGSFRGAALGAVLISAANFLIGMAIAVLWNLQPGASIVIVHTVVFLVFWLLGRVRRIS